MRKLGVLMIILFLTGMPFTSLHSTTLAQNEEDYWYFAWSSAKTQLIAYTLDGQTSIAATNVDAVPASAWRLDNKMVLVTNSNNRVYLLTPNAFTELAVFDAKVSPYLYRYPYVVMVTTDDYPMLGFVLNLQTKELDSLTGYLDGFQPAIAFPSDGQTLRYWSQNERGDLFWNLLERDFATHEEKQLFRADVPGSFSQDGDLWLYLDRLGDQYQEHLFSIDPVEDVLDYENLLEKNFAVIVNQELVIAPNVSLDKPCRQDCLVSIYPLNGGNTISVTLPEMTNFPHVTRINETEALVEVFTNYEVAEIEIWLAETSGQTRLLGSCPLEISQSCFSPDGQWVFTFSADRTHYSLWNSDAGATVLQMEHDSSKTPSIAATFAGNVVAWYDGGGRPQLYFQSGMEMAIRLPEIKGGNFFGVARDGRMLFIQRPPQDDKSPIERPAGIYLYNPLTEAFEVIVGQAVFPLYLNELGH